jgi:hypothetical protein
MVVLAGGATSKAVKAIRDFGSTPDVAEDPSSATRLCGVKRHVSLSVDASFGPTHGRDRNLRW